MVVILLCGTGVGLGLWICNRAISPRPKSLAEIVIRLDGPPPAGDRDASLAERAAASADRLLSRAGIAADRGALELVERSPERHALEKVVLAGLAAGVVMLGGLVLAMAGIALPVPMLGLVALLACALGFVFPDLALRDQAIQRRRAFRHALSAYLDLVNILLAGGAGIETALFAAADAGDGWAFARLRSTLDRARRTGRSLWISLADLGRVLDVGELTELAASVTLAGSHGARIRASLAAKADSLRGHQLAEAESAAEAATERMTIPLAVLLFGFLVLIGYPAIQQITTVTTGGG